MDDPATQEAAAEVDVIVRRIDLAIALARRAGADDAAESLVDALARARRALAQLGPRGPIARGGE